MKARTEHEAAIVPGANGQFDVFADERLVFSKKQQGRFPDPEEILSAL